jgi:hypothetical protein
MSNRTEQHNSGDDRVPVEKTNAYRAGFMNGYTADNPTADPSIAGYMDGYFVQQEGIKSESSES